LAVKNNIDHTPARVTPEVTEPHSRVSTFGAFFAGASAPLALAPFQIWPIAILSPLILLYFLDHSKAEKAGWLGLWYGLGYFGAGASWVYVSIHLYGSAPVALAALLTVLFVMVLTACSFVPLTLLYTKYFKASRLAPVIAFPCLWVLLDWIRSWLFTGFPWLYLGYSHTDTWLGSWGAIIGVHGLTLLTLLSAGWLYQLIKKAISTKTRPSLPGLCLLALPWVLAWPLSIVEWTNQLPVQPLKTTLIQPNVTQDIKWLPEQRIKTLELLKSLTQANLSSDLIVWPENAVPAFPSQATSFLNEIRKISQETSTAVITGIPLSSRQADGTRAIHNSVMATGTASGTYHKQKLVPFGEYVPLQNQLRGLISFFDLPMSNFRPGNDRQTPLQVKSATLSYQLAPFICYEIVYPDFVASRAENTALLLTVSDDSWFGASIGPHQHLQMARMRAMETQRFLIRATNTGYSAIISHTGQIMSQADSNRALAHSDTVSLRGGKTPFMHTGSAPILGLAALGLVLAWKRPTARKSPKSI